VHEGGNFSSREGGANTTFLATGALVVPFARLSVLHIETCHLLGQRLNLNVRFDWLDTEICVTLLHEMLQMVNTRRNLLRAMLQK